MNLQGLDVWWLLAIFSASAAAIWIAGIYVSDTTDVLFSRLVLEGLLVIAVLTVTIIGHELPGSLLYLRMTPATLGIVAVWVAGLFLVSKARKDLPWQKKGDAPGGQERRADIRKRRRQRKE